MTRAQFAPETAVRCVSDEAFMSSSSAGSTRRVSPTARPGRSCPPEPGSARTTSTKPLRCAFDQATSGGGSPVTAPVARAKASTA